VVDCHKVNHTLRDSGGNVLLPTDYLKHYVIGPPDAPGSDVKTYSGPVSVTCDLAKLYPPEVLVAGNYTLEVNYSNFFQPPGIQLFQGSISAEPIDVPIAASINTHIIETEAGAGGSIFLSGSVLSGLVVVKDGSSPTFTITPNPGYHITDVKVDDLSQGPISSYTFEPVTDDHTISATFTEVTISVTVNTSPLGLSFIVDGTTYTTQQTFSWAPGSSHTIATTSPQGSGGTRYIWNSWSDGGAISHTMSPTLNTTYTANFTTQYQLTTTVSPSGAGSVSASPTSADGFYDSGMPVQLTASANTGYQFANWSGDLTGSENPKSLTMNAPRSVGANFTLKTYTITATAGANGTITPSGNVSVNHGASKTFTITANTGYHIVDVNVDGVSKGPITSYTFTNVQGNHTISATFAADTQTYLLTVTKAGTGSGNVIASPGTLVWNGNVGTASYPPNTTVTLTATANTGSTFNGWSAFCSGSGSCSVVIIGSKCTLKMCGPCNAKATFTIKTYTITATAGTGGSISPSGYVKVNQGGDKTFTITPNAGYQIKDVKVDNVSKGAISTYTFSNVTANHTISATFKTPTAAVRPVLECVRNNGNGTYTAYFGYLNENPVPITIALGTNNKFTPNPPNRGQPTVFQPGRIQNAFSVVFNGNNLVWTLKGPDGQSRTSTASRNSAPCP
jgi:hypothetical protein